MTIQSFLGSPLASLLETVQMEGSVFVRLNCYDNPVNQKYNVSGLFIMKRVHFYYANWSTHLHQHKKTHKHHSQAQEYWRAQA